MMIDRNPRRVTSGESAGEKENARKRAKLRKKLASGEATGGAGEGKGVVPFGDSRRGMINSKRMDERDSRNER